MNIEITKGKMLTHDHIRTFEDARQLLQKLYFELPKRDFNPSWKGDTGYMDGVLRTPDLNIGEGFASMDPAGRRIVVLQGTAGPMVYFDRYGNLTGPVVCNGYSHDLAPSWNVGESRGPSGYCADNDQFCEPLMRRAGLIAA